MTLEQRGHHAGDAPAAPGRNSPPLPHPLSQCVQAGGEGIGNPPCQASCIYVEPVPGKAVCNSSGISGLQYYVTQTSWCSSTCSPPAWTLAIRGGVPLSRQGQYPSHSCAQCWYKSRAHCAARRRQHLPTGAPGSCRILLGTELREVMAFWWVDTIAPWLRCQGFIGLSLIILFL